MEIPFYMENDCWAESCRIKFIRGGSAGYIIAVPVFEGSDMYSIRDVALRVGATEAWVRKWIRLLRLGKKVGWAVILDEGDIKMLRARRELNGHKEAA